jgi:hypothetical protein
VTRGFATALALAIACGPRPGATGPGGASADDAVVFVASNVPDAQLYVDGRFVAPLTALRRGIALDPGEHRLELRREAYFSRYLELRLGRAERRQLTLDLAPILP